MPRLLRCWGYLFTVVLFLTVIIQGVEHIWSVFRVGSASLVSLVVRFADYSFEQAGGLTGSVLHPNVLQLLITT